MTDAAQPKDRPEESALSPWWMRAIGIVMVIGFAGLATITLLAYRNAPPVPSRIVDAGGVTLFDGEDIRRGQALFLRYGLMDNGTIWGHGAYLGPDYSAAALHHIGEDSAEAIAQGQYGKRVADLTALQAAAVRGEVAATLKINRYDAASGTLLLTAAQAHSYRGEIDYWAGYFRDPVGNGGLRPKLITDPAELRQLAAFITWAAWASVANRPGEESSYTNNFPYDPDVGNRPTPGALLWSALSLLALLAGIAVVLLAFGRFDYLGWIRRGHDIHPLVIPGRSSRGQRAANSSTLRVPSTFTRTPTSRRTMRS